MCNALSLPFCCSRFFLLCLYIGCVCTRKHTHTHANIIVGFFRLLSLGCNQQPHRFAYLLSVEKVRAHSSVIHMLCVYLCFFFSLYLLHLAHRCKFEENMWSDIYSIYSVIHHTIHLQHPFRNSACWPVNRSRCASGSGRCGNYNCKPPTWRRNSIVSCTIWSGSIRRAIRHCSRSATASSSK